MIAGALIVALVPLTPVPVMETKTDGRDGSFEAIVTVALCNPAAEGENVAVNEHVWPAGTLLHSVGTKSPALDIMPLMFRVAVPVLEITTGAEVELLPTETVPKASEIGATPMMGTAETVTVFDQPEIRADVVL